jgi:hypothetical protein
MKKHFKLLNLILIFSLSLVIIACSASRQVPVVAFTVIANGFNSGYVKKEQIIVENKADFQKMWDRLYVNFSEKPPLPEVNFETQTVIGVFFGEYPNGGGSIGVKTIIYNDDETIVNVEEVTPGPNCVTTDMITQPYQIVRIPKADIPIKFVNLYTVRICN